MGKDACKCSYILVVSGLVMVVTRWTSSVNSFGRHGDLKPEQTK